MSLMRDYFMILKPNSGKLIIFLAAAKSKQIFTNTLTQMYCTQRMAGD